MLDRFEATLESYLAGVFVEALGRVLKSARFQETLRIPEPSVIEFQRGSDLLTVQVGESRGHQRLVVIESETVDLRPLASAAATETILEVSDRLLTALPWVDHSAVRRSIEGSLLDQWKQV